MRILAEATMKLFSGCLGVTDDYFEFDGVMLESSAIQEADNKRPT
jgi:hypothetical protein